MILISVILTLFL